MLALRLPRNNSNPKARALGEALATRNGNDAAAITQEFLSMIRQDFTYTLEPPPLMMDRPIDDFLFQTKSGYCEHFSSAYVFIMRSAGIPARVVTGYLGGVYNSSGDYLLVRNSDAHAWAEYWAPEEGWVRVDPTGAVAPERINQGTVDGALPEAIRWYEQGWLGDLGMRMDWVSSRWRQLVIEFDANRQRRLLEPLGLGDLGTSGLTLALAVLGAAGLALGVWWSMRHRNSRRPDHLGRAWVRFRHRLGRNGLTIEDHLGPEHLRLRAKAKWPERAVELEPLFAGYIAHRYGHGEPATLPALINALKRYR
ncbi:MAG: transglutaminase domain-containing protein [Ahniella sp.]|nr:transglutaminase domain-containing protein [Ahniella sp.]